LAHKTALFSHLQQRWQDLFNVSFDVLLYDLTSTYFEANPPFPEGDKRRFGYSRDHRPDCVQVVIALVVTPDGLPMAYEVLAGNTADSTTLRAFLARIESQYGKARRIWLMDRGIPTEAVLGEMRAADPPVQYLVGTPKGRLTRLQKRLTELDWQQARPGVRVKLLAEDAELYVFAESRERVAKERAMRQRQLKGLWTRLKQLSAMAQSREELLMRLGAARSRMPTAWRLVKVEVSPTEPHFTYQLDRKKLRKARLREGRYLLRTNLGGEDPAQLWEYYIRLVEVEQAFKTLKNELAVRPIFHQKEPRIEAHIFIAFLAYCLHATLRLRLRLRLRRLAPSMTPRSVLEAFTDIQLIDVQVPTTDGRHLQMSRYTEPGDGLRVLIELLKLQLPGQPPPRISAAAAQSSPPL
jgi:transposase